MLVSICIPVYNMEECIERCIYSALNQNYPDFEVVVVDNRSSDKTYHIAASIRDNRLKVYRNNSNLGAYGNHNRCLELAKGEWIKFLHGDDELLPQCISSMVATLSSCPDNIALLGCGAINYGHENKESGKSLVPDSLYVMRPAQLKEFVLEGNIFGTPSMTFIHRKTLIGLGGFDLSMEPASDGDCWIKLRQSFSSAFLPEHLVIIRDDPPGNVRQRIKQSTRFCDQIFRQINKWHKCDSILSKVPLRETFFADWLCNETFRFWRTGLRFSINLRFDLLTILIRNLSKYDLISKSLWFFINHSLRGCNSSNFRGQIWTEALEELRIL